jgi:hypothetical protein
MEMPTFAKMDPYTKGYVEGILSDVNSIYDVTEYHIRKIKRAASERFILDKYQVSAEDFEAWEAKDEQPGVEYDSRLERVIIKAVSPALLYYSPNDCFGRWFTILANQLWEASGGIFYENVGSTGSFKRNTPILLRA